ncbi:hypothetical protein AB0G67_45860 [Streptomyces sp. NPDC021056]|uniref:hypothetical protein n=1 Tax=Streptomyces sp. NPDC021056 TaxID=3155012 RepID=UPI003411A009
MPLTRVELPYGREVGRPPVALRTPHRHHRHALALGIHTDRLQQVLLDRHEPLPPGHLPREPHPEVLALDGDLPRPGRERPGV